MSEISLVKNKSLILIVDDSKFTRFRLRQFLEKDEYEIIEAEDGAQALSMYERIQPDIILMDCIMPVLDGFSACARLQKLPGGNRTPVIMITSLNDDKAVDSAFEAGATDYITKPIHWAVLRQRVHRLLHAKHTEVSLDESEAFAQSIINHALDGIITIDTLGIIHYFNPASEHIFGYKSTEIIGQKINVLIPKFYRSEYEYYLANNQHTGKDRVTGISQEFTGLQKNSSTFFIELTVSEFYVRKQRFFTVILRDITKRKRIEEELQHTIMELRQTQNTLREREKLAIIGQMAAGMAHEIRNPLTTIKGLAQLLKEKYSDNETVTGYMGVILDEVNQANRVISDFLQLARPKQPVLKRQSISMLIKELLAIISPQAFLKNIEVEYEENQILPDCMIDRDQIKQVLLNMCQNSMEAMAEGGKITIKTGFLPGDNELYIDIQDTGCGIPINKLKNIGVPFYTTKASGTGLGLSISYSIIDTHKGRVEVNSTEGEGTRFRVYLPY